MVGGASRRTGAIVAGRAGAPMLARLPLRMDLEHAGIRAWLSHVRTAVCEQVRAEGR